MMEFDRGFRPTTEDEVSEFEDKLGYRLPQEYRRFLLQYNGGKPHNRVFDMPALSDIDEVRYFYGINVDRLYDLCHMREIYHGRVPHTLLPVAGDPLGNQICVSLSADDLGAIYFWDHEMEHVGGNATRIAGNFDAFAGSLRKDI